MRRRFLVIVAVALAVGLTASYLVYRVVSQLQATARSYERDSEEVLVAAVNIGLAETITPQHVRTVRWPKASMPAGILRKVSDADGRVVRSAIVAGEPLIEAKLAPRLAGRGGIMPMLVPDGQRGVTIKVPDAIRESGFILPNSRVDVLVSLPGAGSEQVAKVILQDVLVLAAGQTVEMRDNKPVQVTTVTLALTPEETERLALAQAEGRIMLTTRNLRDNQIVQTRGATKAMLLGSVPRPAVALASTSASRKPAVVPASSPLPVPAVETHAVAIIRAGKVTESVFVRDAGGFWVEQTSKAKSQ
jgi:pilus assembly protein CpaB